MFNLRRPPTYQPAIDEDAEAAARDTLQEHTFNLSCNGLAAWALFHAIQIATRHPTFTGPDARAAERMAERFQEMLCTNETLRDMAERGWWPHTHQDLIHASATGVEPPSVRLTDAQLTMLEGAARASTPTDERSGAMLAATLHLIAEVRELRLVQQRAGQVTTIRTKRTNPGGNHAL